MLVASGTFSSSIGGVVDEEDKRVKPSSLLLSQSQRDRIQLRNQQATSRHIQHKKKNDKDVHKSSDLQRTKTSQTRKSLDDTDKLPEKPKMREIKQKELAAKLQYLKKLQDKERENASILKVSQSMLKHHHQILRQERKTAINLLSKIETVLTAESEIKSASSEEPLSKISLKESIPKTPQLIMIPENKSVSSNSNNSRNPVNMTPSLLTISSQLKSSTPLTPPSAPLTLLDLQTHHQTPNRPLLKISNSTPFSNQPSFSHVDNLENEETEDEDLEENGEVNQWKSSSHSPAVKHEEKSPVKWNFVATDSGGAPSGISKIWGMNVGSREPTDDERSEEGW